MADAKKIKIGSTWYNIKDETARNGLSAKANLASPELTGTPRAPTAASGTNTTQIATTAYVTSAVNSSANNKVSKTGDTMTGALTINREAGNSGVTAKLTNYGLNSLPSSSNALIDPLVTNEKDGNRMGLIRSTLHSDGTVDYMVGAVRPVNGTTIWNTLTFGIGPNGGKTVNVSDASAWRNGLGVGILYFTNQAVSAATSAEIMRITNSAITADTIVLECTFQKADQILGSVTWTSYAGYVSFTGTCTGATTANVTLAKKSN